MDCDEYNNKFFASLIDDVWECLERDHTDCFAEEVKNVLVSIMLLMTPDEKRCLTLMHTMPPLLYCLPKVHQKGYPLRPIVSF